MCWVIEIFNMEIVSQIVAWSFSGQWPSSAAARGVQNRIPTDFLHDCVKKKKKKNAIFFFGFGIFVPTAMAMLAIGGAGRVRDGGALPIIVYRRLHSFFLTLSDLSGCRVEESRKLGNRKWVGQRSRKRTMDRSKSRHKPHQKGIRRKGKSAEARKNENNNKTNQKRQKQDQKGAFYCFDYVSIIVFFLVWARGQFSEGTIFRAWWRGDNFLAEGTIFPTAFL